jgi:porphobilinogen synthase
MMRETRLSAQDFIYPLFVRPGKNDKEEIASMPGQFQWSVDTVVEEAQSAADLGIPAVILFGIPEHKDPLGKESSQADGVVQQAVRAIKRSVPDLVVITDVCLCEYTDHGHCGVLNAQQTISTSLPKDYVCNDETLVILGDIARSHAEAGADMVAPSGMMDGMVASIRSALDEHGFEHLAILSYAVKYASGFYGPFRDAAQGAPAFGDRTTHQMDPANRREALMEAALDIREGADMLMVKPALSYLDIIRDLQDAFPHLPLAAYNVSGEYAMVKAAAQKGWLDERQVVMEALISMKRAGADLILTYHAKDAAQWIQKR